ncbi:MAG: hypothetical protein SGI86_18550 [Deltaproteobacteria bacterium]|nr:hypothetical protein [Deltaproteobacteria bacterium]
MIESQHIIRTAERLRDRIGARFPGAGLIGVAEKVRFEAESVDGLIRKLGRPNWALRGINVLLLIGIAGIVFYILTHFQLRLHAEDVEGFIQFLEPALGSIVFIGAFIWSLVNLENRWRRGKVLAVLHQLRSLAHLVDMHQLAKDPERLVHRGPDTQFSHPLALSAFQLGRYLDYCSDLLSVLSKIGALWAQYFTDPEILRAVDQIENLTNGLSRKIWQKLTLLGRLMPEEKVGGDAESSVA